MTAADTPDPRPVSQPAERELPVGAVLASALMAANYPGDSGEDVDRLLVELEKRGYRLTKADTVGRLCDLCGRPEVDSDHGYGGSHAWRPAGVRLSSDDEGLQADAGLREAAQRVVREAETDDDFEGEYVGWLVPDDAVQALRDALAASSATPAGLDGITGFEVHAAWRDGMLAQGRPVSKERMYWGTLTDQDRELDDAIAARLRAASPRSEDGPAE